jgi:hypothetical protein
MRALVLIAAALLLTACDNTVYSRLPLLTEAHEGGDPEFRPGLYSISGFEDRCQFDGRLKLSLWPDCAVGLQFERGRMWLVTSHQRYLAQTQKFVPGDPVIVQFHWSTDVLKDPRAVAPKGTQNPFYGWDYAALDVVRTDRIGQIMEARMTLALCGPSSPGQGTEHPFPGLAMTGTNCAATDLADVRLSLLKSVALQQPRTIRWLRDSP